MKGAKCSTKTYLEGNVWIRRMQFDQAGMVKDGHIHDFDHITMVVTGSVKAYDVKNGTCLGEFHHNKNPIIYVPKNVAHSIVSLEPKTIALCLQAMRDEETEEVIATDFQNPRWVAPRQRITVTQIPAGLRKKGL